MTGGFHFIFLFLSAYVSVVASAADYVPFGLSLSTLSQGESILAAMKLAHSSIDGIIDATGGLSQSDKSCRALVTSKQVVALIGIGSDLLKVAKEDVKGDRHLLDDSDRQEIIKRLNLIELPLKEVARQIAVLRKTKERCPVINVTLMVEKLKQIKSALAGVDELSLRSDEGEASSLQCEFSA